jgi:hypothetical protein
MVMTTDGNFEDSSDPLQPPSEAALLQQARELRDAPGMVPDPQVLAALQQARQRAVAQLAAGQAQKQGSRLLLGWLGGGAVAAALLTAAVLVPLNEQFLPGGGEPAGLTEFAAVLADPDYQTITEEFELLEELEFLAWVADEELGGAG